MDNLPLRDAFVKREKRFVLLDRGLALAGFEKSWPLLEPGCAGGEAAEHLAQEGYEQITGIDIDPKVLPPAGKARFVCANACALPFDRECFGGIYSEAAFSVIPDKEAAVKEYARVLKNGGRVLLNDFTIRQRTDAPRVKNIPMLEGVQTMDTYRELFEAQGLPCVYAREEFPEFLRIALSLSRTYHVSPAKIGKYLAVSFGQDAFVTDFFSQARMSYCQMIFEKRKDDGKIPV